MKPTRRYLISTAIAAALPISVMAEQPQPLHLTMPRIESQPQISDFLTMDVEEAPHGMRRVDGFVQRYPNDGTPASEDTVAYLGYDAENVHVVFVCFDRSPHGIGAHLEGRDAFTTDEDTVAVHIDTFRDMKHGYGFEVNPLGVQTDGIYTEGVGWDLSWDTVWHSEGRITPRGYVVLFRIPFRSLRFPASEAQEWGLFLYRGIARKNEEVYFPAFSTRMTRFPQAAVVDGIEHVSSGRNVQAIPYLSGRSSKALDLSSDTPAFRSKTADGALGLDAKTVVRNSVILDLTVNPDFSQLESDQPQITVNKPFEVLFPEKRPFFLENAAFFTTPIQLLFTRRIADPLFGARVTGRLGGFSGAAMLVDDRSPFDAAATDAKAWYGVARAIRDIGRESSVGGFLSRRTLSGSENGIAAADVKLRLGGNTFGILQSAASWTRDASGATTGGSASLASLVSGGRRYKYELDLNDRSPGFRAQDGFIPRVDVRSVDQTVSFRARPEQGALQAWGPDLELNRTWDHAGKPLDWAVTPRIAFLWTRATNLEIYHTTGSQTLRPQEVTGLERLLVTSTDRSGFNFSTALFPHLIGSTTFFVGDAPNLTPAAGRSASTGRVLDATAALSLRLSRVLAIDGSYLFDRLEDARSGRSVYSNAITRVRVASQFTRALSARAIVQYNRLSVDPAATALQPTRSLNYDLVLAYLASPGTAVYLGANYDLANLDPLLTPTPFGLLRSPTLNNDGWQVFVKISYLVRP